MATSSSSTSFFGSRDGNTIQPPPPQEPPQLHLQNHHSSVVAEAAAPPSSSSTPPQKKIKRNLPGAPLKYPDADVILLSPRSLMATNRFICEVCNKGFQREQNLQLHRRGHNLPWKLKQKNKDPVRKKVYLCPETTCVHHDAARALGDLTGIKKHYFRKHGEKKFKCEKCSKRYAVQSDWKAHSKTCGTREYRCDCGTLFSRRDSFITHRAFCDALAQESARLPTSLSTLGTHLFSTAGLTGNNSIGLGMGLPHRVSNNHLPSLSDHQMASDILRLGGGSRQFDHLLTNSFQSQQQQQNVQQTQPNFYLSDDQSGQSQTDYYDQNIGHQGQNQGQNTRGGIFSNKFFHGQQLNQMSSFQQESASHPSFGNVGFYTGNDNSTTDTNTMNSGASTGSGDHSSAMLSPGAVGGLFGGPPQMSLSGGLSSLYSSGPALQHQSAMSATALLQRAAKMGPTTSTTNASTIAQLKSFEANKAPPPPPQQPSSPSGGGGGGDFRGLYGENDRSNLHDLLIRDLSRDNHLLMSSTLFDHLQDNNHNNNNNNNNSLNYNGDEYINNYNGLNSKNTKDGLTIALSDRQTRDFLGVGEIVRRSMNSGGGFTPSVEQHQCGHINNNNNNNMVKLDNIDHMNNNNNNTIGATSSQAYEGGNNSFQ